MAQLQKLRRLYPLIQLCTELPVTAMHAECRLNNVTSLLATSYQFRLCYISSSHTRLIRRKTPMSVNECNGALLSVAVHFEFARGGVAQCCALSSDRQAGHYFCLAKA